MAFLKKITIEYGNETLELTRKQAEDLYKVLSEFFGEIKPPAFLQHPSTFWQYPSVVTYGPSPTIDPSVPTFTCSNKGGSSV